MPPPGPQGALGQASGGPEQIIQTINAAAARMDAIGEQLMKLPGVDLQTLHKGIETTKMGIKLIVASLAHAASTSPHGPAMMNQLQQMGGPPGG